MGKYNRSHTIENYGVALKEYCEYTNKSPTQMIEEAREDIKSGKLMDERRIFEEFLRFVAFMNSTKMSPNTKRLRICGIASFFKNFYIEVPTSAVSIPAEPLKENIKIPEREDIQEALKIADLLERAVVLVGVASGLSAEDICNLKVRDFKEGFDSKTGITTLQLRREKTRIDFVTYLTPEASQAVYDYLEKYRNRSVPETHKERFDQIRKQKIQDEDGYLFILRKIPEEFFLTGNEELRKIRPRQFLEIYGRLAQKAKKESKRGWNLIRSHNMRKFFYTQLRNAGADADFAELLMGHKIGGVKTAYYPSKFREYKNLYLKFVPFLTIQKENLITETPEFQQLTEEVQKLKSENETLKLDRFENESLKQLKREVEKLRKAQNEKEELEKTFSEIIAGEFSVLNQKEDWAEKYEKHWKRLRADPVYKKKFNEYEKPFLTEVFGANFEKETEEFDKKEKEERKRLRNAEDKLYNALTGTKTLADSL